MSVTAFRQLANRTILTGDDLMYNLNLLRNKFGSIDATDILSTSGLLSNTTHGYLGTGNYYHNAAGIYVADSGSKFASHALETVLTNLATVLNMSGGSIIGGAATAKYVGYSYQASTAADCKVVVPANTATSAILVMFGCTLTQIVTGSNASTYVPININTTALSASGSADPRFHLYQACAGTMTSVTTPAKSMVINTTTVPAFDKTIENTIVAGTLWNAGATNGTVAEYQMTVIAL